MAVQGRNLIGKMGTLRKQSKKTIESSFDWRKLMRKILKNNNKSKRINGTKNDKIGTQLCILDKFGNLLSVGDKIKYGKYKGVLLYNYQYNQYGVVPDDSMWYGDDKYNIDSYGKFIEIPMDNGAKMELEVISNIN